VVDLDVGGDVVGDDGASSTPQERETESTVSQTSTNFSSGLQRMATMHHQMEYLQRIQNTNSLTAEYARQFDEKTLELMQLIDIITAPLRRSNRQQH
jgi:hypothetical protein